MVTKNDGLSEEWINTRKTICDSTLENKKLWLSDAKAGWDFFYFIPEVFHSTQWVIQLGNEAYTRASAPAVAGDFHGASMHLRLFPSCFSFHAISSANSNHSTLAAAF